MKPLSKKQAVALQWIRDYTTKNQWSPSLAEIADGLGVKSSSTAKALVDRLVAKEYLAYDRGAHRSIRVVK